MTSAHHETWDLIIVGAGTAGLPCAITAAERGANVLVIDKAAGIGGTLSLSGGHMSGGGTRRQREKGIADSPDLHYADVMRICRGTADPALVRLAVDHAPHTIDWLHDLGFPFAPECPAFVHGHELYQIPRTHWGIDQGASILSTLRPRWDSLVEAGRITLRLGHELTDLLCDGHEVVGITIKHLGRFTEQYGRAVVLTSGGYARNQRLFVEVTPGQRKLISAAMPTSTGDGIICARRIGARFRHGEMYLASLGGLELEPGSGVAEWGKAWALIFSPAYRMPREIYVNLCGERFIAEDEPSPDARERAVLQQPDEKFWIVFDAVALDDGPCLVRQWRADDIKSRAREAQIVWSAETLESLAVKTGIDAVGLIRTVNRYNEAVRTGDDEFGRKHLVHGVLTPPFYAVLTHASSLISFGGLAVDRELRVLDEHDEPIAGLYAAGEILGAAATSGQAFCGGMLVTPAISFGRILGRTLVKSW